MTTPPFVRLRIPTVLAVATAFIAAPASAETVDTITRNFQVGAGSRLAIDVDGGAIEIQTGPGSTMAVEIVRTFRASSKEMELAMLARHEVKVEQSGDSVTIRACGQRPNSTSGIWPGSGSRRQARYRVTVPADCDASLKTSGGPISVTGLRSSLQAHTAGGPLRFIDVTGPISGSTSGGPINLETCAGTVDLHTSGGPIEAAGCSGSFKLSSSGGGIEVTGHRGSLKLHTSGGPIRVNNLDGSIEGFTSGGTVSVSLQSQPTGDCRLRTSGGGIALTVPPDAGFVLDAHTSTGGVSCSLTDCTQVERSRGRLRAVHCGGGPRIALSSSGGGIDIAATGSTGG